MNYFAFFFALVLSVNIYATEIEVQTDGKLSVGDDITSIFHGSTLEAGKITRIVKVANNNRDVRFSYDLALANGRKIKNSSRFMFTLAGNAYEVQTDGEVSVGQNIISLYESSLDAGKISRIIKAIDADGETLFKYDLELANGNRINDSARFMFALEGNAFEVQTDGNLSVGQNIISLTSSNRPGKISRIIKAKDSEGDTLFRYDLEFDDGKKITNKSRHVFTLPGNAIEVRTDGKLSVGQNIISLNKYSLEPGKISRIVKNKDIFGDTMFKYDLTLSNGKIITDTWTDSFALAGNAVEVQTDGKLSVGQNIVDLYRNSLKPGKINRIFKVKDASGDEGFNYVLAFNNGKDITPSIRSMFGLPGNAYDVKSDNLVSVGQSVLVNYSDRKNSSGVKKESSAIITRIVKHTDASGSKKFVYSVKTSDGQVLERLTNRSNFYKNNLIVISE